MAAVRVKRRHAWDLSIAEATRLQETLAAEVREDPFPLERVRYVAGLDVSSERGNPVLTAGAIVWDRVTSEVVAASSAQGAAPFPYVPGYLSFREAPILLEALASLSIEPDAILIDGHGRAHPRRLGIASHLGVLLEAVTVGVAKSVLCGEGKDPPDRTGAETTLLESGEEIGRIVRTKKGRAPIHVSVGNRITLDDGVALVLACCRDHRLPEPLRLAHEHVNLVRTTGSGLIPVDAEQMQLL